MHPAKELTDPALNETRELLIGRQNADNVTPFILDFTDLRKGHVVLKITPEKEWEGLAKELNNNFTYMGAGVSK